MDSPNDCVVLGSRRDCRILLEAGANVNNCNEYCLTALRIAVHSSLGHPAIPTLLQYGANVTVRGEYDNGGSILHMVKRDAEAFGALLNRCRGTMAEDDFCELLLHKNRYGSISLHYTKSVNIAKLLVEQPRHQDDNHLLPACHAQLVSKDGYGLTPRVARREESTGREDLLLYLESYESLAVSIPVETTECVSSNDEPKRHKLLNSCIAVKSNPLLNDFQKSVAQEAFDLLMATTECTDSVAHAVLGYLSPLDVMKRARVALPKGELLIRLEVSALARYLICESVVCHKDRRYMQPVGLTNQLVRYNSLLNTSIACRPRIPLPVRCDAAS